MKFYFVYYHLREILVNSGTVHAGDVIGLSGISGIEKGTHGPHLHFEIRSKRWCNGLNNRCNPAYYVIIEMTKFCLLKKRRGRKQEIILDN